MEYIPLLLKSYTYWNFSSYSYWGEQSHHLHLVAGRLEVSPEREKELGGQISIWAITGQVELKVCRDVYMCMCVSAHHCMQRFYFDHYAY